MRRPRLILSIVMCAAVLLPAFVDTASGQARPRPRGDVQGALGRQIPRGYQEPAFARGYTDGYERGRSDGRAGKRYDPVGHRDYRNGDQSYYRAYGSRDAYKNNYRAGFRQGYEAGYRANT